ncbi:MAG: hypothetical protein RR211_03120 [Pseudoflavonifractor sp.]
MNFLRSKRRFGVYALLLGLLGFSALLALWGVAKTGAYLSDEGDWQTLAGEYRIGIIDYTVDIDGQRLLEPAGSQAQTFEMLVPLRGGVRMFDPTVSAENRGKEFGEGINLVRVRVVNHSDSTVEVGASFKLKEGSANSLRFLPVPTTFGEAAARSLNKRQYALDTVGMQDVSCTTAEQETVALNNYATKYNAYRAANPAAQLPGGILSGATSVIPGEGQNYETVTVDGKTKYYFYKDVFLLVWSEYGSGEFNAALTTSPKPRTGQFLATFTVGQLE